MGLDGKPVPMTSRTQQSVKATHCGHATATVPKVAVVYTRPETVIADIGRAMRLAEYGNFLDPALDTLLKINISWQHYYPACSTTPWQLDGVISALSEDGYEGVIPAHNGTVVVDPHEGAFNNRHTSVERRHGLSAVYLDEPPTKWVNYQPKARMLALDDIYPEGIQIPEIFPGRNVIHLPTVKTHVFTTVTGAMKNAFGGLLHRRRHWTHSVIHETLVDLLAIQREIHPGIFAVMDGTLAGDGPGPRAMRWHEKNVLLASADQVAIDATAARMMGLDPLSLKFIRLAHEAGLGVGDPREIEVVGEDIGGVNWQFSASENTLASKGQKLIYWGPLRPLEKLLLRSPMVPWAFAASNIYHNDYWLRFVGRRRIREAMKTGWGRLFQTYGA